MQTIATPKSVREFGHRPLPKRFFNFERLMDTMKTRNIDVIVASGIYNVFYLTGYNSVSQRVDEPRPIAVVISRHEPDHPIIVIADCCLSHFLYQPTWVEDFRPFQSSLVPIGYPVDPNVFDQMMPKEGLEKEWVKRAREHYAPNMVQATKKAIRSLMPQNGRIAFDDLRFANRILEPGQELVDAYGPLMYVREVKTPQEIHLLKEATRLNQTAIETAIAAWEPGMTWHQLGHLYHKLCIDMGGFIRDPGAAAVANPRGTDPALTLASGLDPDFVLEKGTNVMLDCHGSLDLYCWDGGKTWVAGDGPSGLAQRIGKAAGGHHAGDREGHAPRHHD